MEVGPPRNDLVLIVEDEPDNREIMRVVVEDLLGYSAATVAEGGEAVETAVKRCPAVVLMDLMLPGVDGFDAIRRIKSNPATSKIPVIAVTALGRSADKERAVEAGADAFLSKPFDIDALVALVEQYVDAGNAVASMDSLGLANS